VFQLSNHKATFEPPNALNIYDRGTLNLEDQFDCITLAAHVMLFGTIVNVGSTVIDIHMYADS
jgi:hypothetical protein